MCVSEVGLSPLSLPGSVSMQITDSVSVFVGMHVCVCVCVFVCMCVCVSVCRGQTRAQFDSNLHPHAPDKSRTGTQEEPVGNPLQLRSGLL